MDLASGFSILIGAATSCAAGYALYRNRKAELPIEFVSNMLWLILLRSLFAIAKCVIIGAVHYYTATDVPGWALTALCAMDTFDDFCIFCIVWLVTINYYETAQQLELFITQGNDSDKQSLLAKPKRRNKKSKALTRITWIVSIIMFVCYLF